MTSVAYTLGTPRPAGSRGGDCRARDLSTDLDAFGIHRFASPSHCRITNGLLRLDVSSASLPTVNVSVWRGRLVIADTYSDTYSDTYGGMIGTPEWLDAGSLVFDSPALTAVLADARLVLVDPEMVVLRLVVPLLADVFLTLRRGERMVRIQHGSTLPPLVDTDRRVRWTPSPVGTAISGRVQEVTADIDAMYRWVGAVDPVTVSAGAFSVTASSVVTARMGAGIGTDELFDGPSSQHSQLGDASPAGIVVQPEGS
jgi:hypothetical protein